MRIKSNSVFMFPVIALVLSGCVETQAAAGGISSSLMTRAETVAGSAVSPAELSAAFAEGEGLKIIEDQPAGKNFASACTRLYSATNSQDGLNALDPTTSITLAKCAGFRS